MCEQLLHGQNGHCIVVVSVNRSNPGESSISHVNEAVEEGHHVVTAGALTFIALHPNASEAWISNVLLTILTNQWDCARSIVLQNMCIGLWIYESL